MKNAIKIKMGQSYKTLKFGVDLDLLTLINFRSTNPKIIFPSPPKKSNPFSRLVNLKIFSEKIRKPSNFFKP